MKYIKFFIVGLLITFTFWFVDLFTVKAYSAGNPVKSGDSLKGVASIGSKVVGSNYFYNIAPGTVDESILSFSTQFDYVPIENFNTDTLGGTSTLGFQVNYCLNSGGNNNEVGLFAIYSAYNNSIDYIYPNGTSMYLSDGEWSLSGCFTAFVRLKVNAVSLAFDGFTYYDVSDYNNNFAVKNTSNYNYILRYTDLIYLNETDYQNALNAAKNTVENQTQINQNQTQINQNQQIIQGQDEIKDSITSEDGPSNLDSLGNAAGWLPPGPVDGILNLPLNMLNNISTNLSKSCSPINLPLPFVNKDLELPCINTLYSQIDGLSAFIDSISIIISGLILYSYFLKLYKWVDEVTSMKETNTVDDWGGL